MAERLALHHGKYRIVAGPLQDAWAGYGYLGARMLYKCRASAGDEATAKVRRWLDAHDRKLRAQRRDGRPTVEEYRWALALVPMGAQQEAMLRAHARAAARTVSAAELAAAGGFDDGETAQLHYGRLGRRIAEFIGFRPAGPRQRGEPLWTAAIAAPHRGEDGSWSWVLFPEVAEALEALSVT